ncbi:hypothetical protein [Aquimarina agarivorans]|uniref:hypothetical protein n=1 Tax=Aquimarina agarivorans TaxID=980584 RepID=UPI000248EBFE|nr:hypothetical protein [Aquimarina agarivorans]
MKTILLKLFVSLLITSCTSDESQQPANNDNMDNINPSVTSKDTMSTDGVQNVTVSGNENEYTFSVTVKSPDTGCDQYADWWEVIDLEGNLIYRRILVHSHVNEQPFARSGGKVSITSKQQVIVRAHMNTSGYLPQVSKGTVANGFSNEAFDTKQFEDAAQKGNLPTNCAF